VPRPVSRTHLPPPLALSFSLSLSSALSSGTLSTVRGGAAAQDFDPTERVAERVERPEPVRGVGVVALQSRQRRHLGPSGKPPQTDRH
jgi:hypothetical protein